MKVCARPDASYFPSMCLVMGVSHLWYCMCGDAMVLLRERLRNHYDPKVQFTFSNLFGNTLEVMTSRCICIAFCLVPGIHLHLFGDSLF